MDMELRQVAYNSIIEDFYNTPEGERVELIDGEIYNMAPPTSKHQGLVMQLSHRIQNHIDAKGGDCRVYPAPFGVHLDEDDPTIVEPDITVICDPNKIKDRGCEGVPDWIIEIVSPSDPGHDYITKLQKYHSAGVREYWIVDPGNDSITVYIHGKEIKPRHYTFSDSIKVSIYDDLVIDFAEVMRRI